MRILLSKTGGFPWALFCVQAEQYQICAFLQCRADPCQCQADDSSAGAHFAVHKGMGPPMDLIDMLQATVNLRRCTLECML